MCAIGIPQRRHGFIVTKPQAWFAFDRAPSRRADLGRLANGSREGRRHHGNCLEPCDDRLGLCRISSKPVAARMISLGEPSCVPT